MELNDLKGKVVFISGASSGIGEGAALRFASLGCNLVLNGRNERNLQKVSDLCIEHGLQPNQVLIAKADVSKEEDVKKAIELTIAKFQRLDVLVNNAAVVLYGSIEMCSMKDYDVLMDNNLKSAVMLTKYAVPHLIKSKGCVVNVSSISSLLSLPGELFYAISKAGMDQLTTCTAIELAPKGVRVNSVNPGVVKTNIHLRAGFTEAHYKKFLEAQNSLHPLGRYGEVEDTASAIVFLASSMASWITGAILPVDGGRIRAHPLSKL